MPASQVSNSKIDQSRKTEIVTSTEKEQKQRKELLLFNYDKQPKIKLSFDGCYKYDKLKKEGLVS